MRSVFADCLAALLVCAGVPAICLFAPDPSYSAQPNSSQTEETQSTADQLPPLSQARDVGRKKSLFLKQGDSHIEPQSQGPPKADLLGFQKLVAPVFAKSCVDCHGPTTTEGNLRVDQLNPDLLTGPHINKWLEVFGALTNGEMPPEDAEHLADDDRAKIIEWLGNEIQKASRVRRSDGGHSSFRRLTRYEYNYALQDLLGLTVYDFSQQLPPETSSEDGFKNSSELLQMSPMQFQTYREIALKALRKATVSGERPKMVVYRMTTKGENGESSEKYTAATPEQIGQLHHLNQNSGKSVSFSRRNRSLKMKLDRFLPDEGIMRVRIRAGRTSMNPDEYASLRLVFSAHTSNNANFSQVISSEDYPVTASIDEPEMIHFDIPLGEIQRNPFRKLKTTFPRRDEFLTIETITNGNRGKNALNVEVDFIEILAPFYEQWPPKSHSEFFLPSANKSNEEQYAAEILTAFLSRAWRRPVTATDVEPYVSLLKTYRPEFEHFEQAMVEVLATALASPEFLYLVQRSANSNAAPTENLSQFELATRLSFFLWSSVPDEELLTLARQGRLTQPSVLAAQVDRMLNDPRASRFSRHFVEQWLGLEGLNAVTHIGDSQLRDAMREEPIAFFTLALKQNSSVLDFIHSDYVLVNERLARHYKMPKVFGPHFRKVEIDPQSHRGGMLTTAAVLTMNSDGADSHPLKRGIWLLEHILHDPPPPPPPNVPEVDLTDPRILEMTLKERIADHRNKAACYSCHAKIDPWGIAFEHYDALGNYRTQVKNKPVDAKSVLFNKQELAGLEGVKRYLLADRQDQVTRALVHKMAAYALGRPLTFSDRADIDSLTVKFRMKQDGLRDLVFLIVSSPLFQSK